jgi:RNA polymerase sigma factor (sigma-70 family)
MLSSEDAIDFVAHHIMRGDWAFDPSRGNKISTCRGLNGRLAILEYIKVVSNQRQAISMEFVVDGNRTLSDVSEDPKAVEPQTIHMQRESDQEMRDYIRRLLDALTPVQRSCIALHYLDDIGQADVAKMVGISREGVRRAIAKGMQKLLALATEESEDG